MVDRPRIGSRMRIPRLSRGCDCRAWLDMAATVTRLARTAPVAQLGGSFCATDDVWLASDLPGRAWPQLLGCELWRLASLSTARR